MSNIINPFQKDEPKEEAPMPFVGAKVTITDKNLVITYKKVKHRVSLEEGVLNLLELDDCINNILMKVWKEEHDKAELRRSLMGQ